MRFIVQIGTSVTIIIVSLRLLIPCFITGHLSLLFDILVETKKNIIKIDQLNILNL